jgi:hypothetical protein
MPVQITLGKKKKPVTGRYDTDLLLINQENLKVKPEIQTTQSEGEMESAFAPGSAFGFNVVLQLETPDSDDPEEKPGSDDDLQEESGSSE